MSVDERITLMIRGYTVIFTRSHVWKVRLPITFFTNEGKKTRLDKRWIKVNMFIILKLLLCSTHHKDNSCGTISETRGSGNGSLESLVLL